MPPKNSCQISRIASDFEFVKKNNRAYVRSAVFLRLPKDIYRQQLKDLLTPSSIVTLKPNITLQVAHTLPTGHALRASHTEILQATLARVQSAAPCDTARKLSANEKSLHDQGLTIIHELASELCAKSVYCIPNINALELNAPLTHSAFRQIHKHVLHTGSYSIRRCIDRLSRLSEACSQQSLSTLPKSFFLRVIIEFLGECFGCSQTELLRIHNTLTSLRLNDRADDTPGKSTDVHIADSIAEVGKHLSQYLIREHARNPHVVLYFYGSSDVHALINTLETYQKGITRRNSAIRDILFHAVDITNHTTFDPIFRHASCRIPKLHESLAALSELSDAPAYQAFLRRIGVFEVMKDSDHHNPVWDTQALACILSACEWLQKQK